jgi:hypothetical protein
LVAVRLISYLPLGKLNVGFCVVLNTVQPVVAFLNDHLHEVGILLDESVNATKSGAIPERGVPVKPATGGSGVTLTHVICVDMLDPAAFVAVRLMLQFPTPNTCTGF